MSIRDFLIFLFKWSGTILGTLTLVVGLVTTFVYLFPPQYEAQARVLIEGNRTPVDRASFTQGVENIEAMTTAVEIIKSRTVLEAVVDELEPHKKPLNLSPIKQKIRAIKNKMQEWGLIRMVDRHESWVLEFEDWIDVEPVSNSNILLITYKHEEATWTADVINSLLNHYISQHLKIYSGTGSSSFYLVQMQLAQQQLQNRRAELDRYMLESNSVNDDQRKELNHALAQILAKKPDLESTLSELLVNFNPDHVEVQLAQEKLRKLNQSIIRREAQLRDMDKHVTRIEELKKLVTADEEPFLNLKRRYDEARLKELSSSDMVNVHIVDHAQLPQKPKRSRLFFIVISFPVGLIMAFSLAFLREYFDRRVFDPAQAEAILGVPEIGSVTYTRNTSRLTG